MGYYIYMESPSWRDGELRIILSRVVLMVLSCKEDMIDAPKSMHFNCVAVQKYNTLLLSYIQRHGTLNCGLWFTG